VRVQRRPRVAVQAGTVEAEGDPGPRQVRGTVRLCMRRSLSACRQWRPSRPAAGSEPVPPSRYPRPSELAEETDALPTQRVPAACSSRAQQSQKEFQLPYSAHVPAGRSQRAAARYSPARRQKAERREAGGCLPATGGNDIWRGSAAGRQRTPSAAVSFPRLRCRARAPEPPRPHVLLQTNVFPTPQQPRAIRSAAPTPASTSHRFVAGRQMLRHPRLTAQMQSRETSTNAGRARRSVAVVRRAEERRRRRVSRARVSAYEGEKSRSAPRAHRYERRRRQRIVRARVYAECAGEACRPRRPVQPRYCASRAAAWQRRQREAARCRPQRRRSAGMRQ